MKEFDVVIVGSGHSGAQAASVLRQAKFTGSIAIIGEEPELPYHRPPLSKEYLAGEKTFDRILLKAPEFWDKQNIEIIAGERVITVDAESHTVTTASGKTFAYEKLVWAAGGEPRRLDLEGADAEGVYKIRTRADSDAMMAALPTVQNVVVIGGGYIGLEAAAVLTKMGKNVTVVENQPRVLSRVAGPIVAEFFTAAHRRAGVVMCLSAGVQSINTQAGRVNSVTLDNGQELPTDMLIVGIGILPSVQPLIDAGAEGGNGVLVDAKCRTSLPDVFAVGDCAFHQNQYANDTLVRLESVQNANDMAAVAAKTIAGIEASYNSIPWFWSNQYDIKLQTMGLSSGFDEEILRGDPASGAFSVLYRRGGELIAADCVNSPADYVQSKLLIMKKCKASESDLVDLERPLKDFL